MNSEEADRPVKYPEFFPKGYVPPVFVVEMLPMNEAVKRKPDTPQADRAEQYTIENRPSCRAVCYPVVQYDRNRYAPVRIVHAGIVDYDAADEYDSGRNQIRNQYRKQGIKRIIEHIRHRIGAGKSECVCDCNGK